MKVILMIIRKYIKIKLEEIFHDIFFNIRDTYWSHNDPDKMKDDALRMEKDQQK